MRLLIIVVCAVGMMALLPDPAIDIAVERKSKLSEYNFFKGKLSDLQPVEGLVEYNVNTPLFSNYAEKLRFIKLPENGLIDFNDSSTFNLPQGTILIKNFYYPVDFRKPNGPRHIIETRLLVHQPSGWEAWPYIWNEEQSDADYDPAGEIRTVAYIDGNGKKKSVPYAIPNRNQCKGCHVSGEKMLPIGITARQLNGKISVEGKSIDQLQSWQDRGMFSVHILPKTIVTLPVWTDRTQPIDQRARAYLDANCAHCHSRKGPASTSGLFLDYFETDPVHLGVNKTPVAAGRGSGNLTFDIVPGKPEQSILLYRMKTNDPAVAMPELGREQVHEEGVQLIEEWIRKGKF